MAQRILEKIFSGVQKVLSNVYIFNWLIYSIDSIDYLYIQLFLMPVIQGLASCQQLKAF